MVCPVRSARAKAGWAKARDRDLRIQNLNTMLKVYGYDDAHVQYVYPADRATAQVHFNMHRKSPFEFLAISKVPVPEGCRPTRQLFFTPNLEMMERCVKAFLNYDAKAAAA